MERITWFLTALTFTLLTIASPASAVTTPVGLIADSPPDCSILADNDLENHIYITTGLANLLGIDTADFQNGDRRQVRVTARSKPLLGRTSHVSTAVYTVTQICVARFSKAWFGNFDHLFLHVSDAVVSAFYLMEIEPVAPGDTTVTVGQGNPATNQNFVEPIPNKHLEEAVTIHNDKRVVMLVPHGGKIESGTSEQGVTFVSAMENPQGPQAPPAQDVNVWDVDGKFGDNQTHERFHITSTDIRPEGYPGLDQLLDDQEPLFDAATSRHFEYAVAFHGFDSKLDYGIILGGAVDQEIRCYIAAAIEAETVGTHIAGQIRYLIPDHDNANNNVEVRGFVGTFGNLSGLAGHSPLNIVNWISAGVDSNNNEEIIADGGIQLEQSNCVRQDDHEDQDKCDLSLWDEDDGDEPARDIVARGVANALHDILANPAVTVGACNQL